MIQRPRTLTAQDSTPANDADVLAFAVISQNGKSSLGSAGPAVGFGSAHD